MVIDMCFSSVFSTIICCSYKAY